MWTFYGVLAAALTTALLAFHTIISQFVQLPTNDIPRVIFTVQLAGILAGAFSYAAIHTINLLAGRDFYEILEGHEQLSSRWFYVAMLGVIVGAGVALFGRLAVDVLPLLPSHPFLSFLLLSQQ